MNKTVKIILKVIALIILAPVAFFAVGITDLILSNAFGAKSREAPKNNRGRGYDGDYGNCGEHGF